MTAFITSAILAADYFCLVRYISSDGNCSEVYLDCLMTALKCWLDVLYCRVTALDKSLNSQVIACIRWAQVPQLSFKGSIRRCAEGQ